MVDTADILDDAVTGAKIAADSIGASHIVNGAVGTLEIADNAINAAKIQAGAVGASEIATAAVGTDELADGAVTGAKLAQSSVGASQIVSGAVGSSEIAASAVGASHLAADSVGASEIVAQAVGTDELADGAVTAEKLSVGELPTSGRVLSTYGTSPNNYLKWIDVTSGTPAAAWEPDICMVRTSVDIAITTSAAPVSWPFEISDLSGMHATSSSAITCVTSGLYHLTATFWVNNPTLSPREITIHIFRATTDVTSGILVIPAQSTYCGVVSWMTSLSPGTEVSCKVHADATGTYVIYPTTFSVVRVK